MVTKVLIYGVELWGGTISLNAWNEIEKMQNIFLRRQLRVKFSTKYYVMLLETSPQLIKMMSLQKSK